MDFRRTDKEIGKAYDEFWHKVWWHRHQTYAREIKAGDVILTDGEMACFKKGAEKAAKMEKKYGRNNLIMTDFDFGLVSGRMSALAWVGGTEWDESMDT